jgi:hypothetical protein
MGWRIEVERLAQRRRGAHENQALLWGYPSTDQRAGQGDRSPHREKRTHVVGRSGIQPNRDFRLICDERTDAFRELFRRCHGGPVNTPSRTGNGPGRRPQFWPTGPSMAASIQPPPKTRSSS